MKRSIYPFFLLLISILPAFSQTVQLDSPVYLGALLVDQTETKFMTEICQSYKYTRQPDEDGFMVYISSNGDKVRFKAENDSTIVEVNTKEKSSTINKKLIEAGFQKSKNTYERGSKLSKRKTTCTLSSFPTTLHFTKSYR